MPDSKYYNTYDYSLATSPNALSFSRYHLGEASKETLTNLTSPNAGCYNDYSYPILELSSWIVRGDWYNDNIGDGIFAFSYSSGKAFPYSSFRSVLTVK